MSLVMPEVGAVYTLEQFKLMIADSQWTCSLYTNDHDPDYEDTLEDYTLADTIQTYANFGTQFSDPVGEGDGKATMSIDYLDFQVEEEGEVTVYGYVVYTDETVIFAEKLPYPVMVEATNQKVRVKNI